MASLITLLQWILYLPMLILSVLSKPILDLVQTKYRWIVVIPLVLPLSKLYNFYLTLRNKYVFMRRSAPKEHALRVAKVSHQMKLFSQKDQQMCTGRSSYDSMSIFHAKYKETMKKVDLSGFIDILEINSTRKTVKVEPMVTCGQLTHTLLPLGWTLAVLPELDDLTVGGLIMGFGIESSSHKYGLFQHICLSYEIVLPNGEVVNCSESENQDLFYAIPWSHGTIGFLLSAVIRIVPAKRYAEITYEPFHNKEALLKRFEEVSLASDQNEFVECLMYGPGRGVVMTGNFCDKPTKGRVHHLGAWYAPWFYKHVESFLKTGRATEYIPLRDYYHRHTRSIFWNMEDIIPFGNNIIFRLFLGWLLPPKISFLKMTTTEKLHQLHVKTHVIEDFIVPVSRLSETLSMQDDLVGFYPLWLCPCQIFPTPKRGLINPFENNTTLYVDVGIYGMAPRARTHPDHFINTYIDLHKRMEKFVRDVSGYQALYALTYQSQEEFEQMFDHTLYNQVRSKYHADKSLPYLYTKVSKEGRK